LRINLKYLLLYALGVCGCIKNVRPQNLVPNWSFEEYNDSCSNSENFDNVKDWLPKRYLQGYVNALLTFSTPDYYSNCIPSPLYTPPTLYYVGYQLPFNSNSFTGLIYHPNTDREAIRVKLKETLKFNTCYHAEMYVNLSNDGTYICDKLGMAFTTDSFSMKVDGSIPMPQPQVYTDLLITDTLNWTKVEGDFIANGGEEWLTIGWFFPASQITYSLFGDTTAFGIVTSAYYLVDAVQVYPCTNDEEAIQLPNLITPNGDGKNDLYLIDSLPPNSKVSFFNRWGNQIYSTNNYLNDWDGTFNGNLLPTGTYFVVVEMPLGTRKSTFVELMY
jgi:gliding motility-associated-like protein